MTGLGLRSLRRAALMGLAFAAGRRSARPESSNGARPGIAFGADASVTLADFRVPFSAFASDEAKAGWLQMYPAGSAPAPVDTSDLLALRAKFDKMNEMLAAQMRRSYPVTIEPRTIAGVRTEVIRPAEGVAPGNEKRVLINLHGGNFAWGEGAGGQVESIPIASVGGITVISVAYRQAPEHCFPAGSEDAAAVYEALLADHRPDQIGIYGSSAGGVLTAQTVALFLSRGVPVPGAIGTFCGTGAPMAGDSMAFNQALTNDFSPKLGEPYLAGVDWSDPLVAPVDAPETLAQFPPTLLLAGGRDFALSSLFHAQRRMTAAGVEAELHVWDGLPHSFFAHPQLPESREVYAVVAQFFDRRLAR